MPAAQQFALALTKIDPVMSESPARNPDTISPGRFALFLGLTLAAVFSPVLFLGETFYYRDFGALAIPTAVYQKASLLAGEIPFWNPYSNCGAPFLAQWGTMVLYPLSLIYVLLPMPWALNFFCIAHLWLGGMGMYLLARRWTNSTWAAALGATAFVFNGLTLAALAWPNYSAAIALFPWVVLTAERAWNPRIGPVLLASRERSKSGAIITAAVVAALQLLTGVPELCALTWIILALLWAVRAFSEPAIAKKSLLRFAAVAAATAGFVAIQVLPFLELLENSQRAPGFNGGKWELPFAALANLVLPRFRTFVTPEGTAFQYGQAFLTSIFLGAPLLFLAALSWRARDRRARSLAILCLFAILLALGANGLLFPILTQIIPPLGLARYTVKFLFILAFAVPLLAAFGLQQLQECGAKRRVLIGAALGLTVIYAALLAFNHARPLQFDRLDELRTNSLARWLFAIALLAALFFAMSRTAMSWFAAALLVIVADAKTHLRLNPTTSSAVFRGHFWQGGPREFPGRIFISPEAEARLLHSTVTDLQKDLAGKRMAQWSHFNLMDQMAKVNGSSTLQIREQAFLQNSLYSGTNAHLEAWLDFLNVTHQTASNSVVEFEDRGPAAPFVTAGQAILFTNYFPLNGPFDFRDEVIIHSIIDEPPRPRVKATFSSLSIDPHLIQFEVTAASPTVAVIAQSWFPSWKASITHQNRTVDNIPLLRANLAFQALPLPAGKSSVRIYYDDHSFKLGAALSAATLLACALFRVREKKRSGHL